MLSVNLVKKSFVKALCVVCGGNEMGNEKLDIELWQELHSLTYAFAWLEPPPVIMRKR